MPAVEPRRCTADPAHGFAVAVVEMPDEEKTKYLCGECAEAAVALIYCVRFYSESESAAETRMRRLAAEKHYRLHPGERGVEAVA